MPGKTSSAAGEPRALANGGDVAKERLDSIAARDDLSHELEATFDLELMETAMQRVRLRAAPRTWRAFVDDRGRRHPRAGGRAAGWI